MTDGAIPPNVETFVVRHLTTVVHMEALLLLREHGREGLHVDAIAGSLYVDRPTAQRVLGDLCRSGLVQLPSPTAPYHYAPYSAELRSTIDDLAEVYRTRLIPLSRFIHERAAVQSIQDFADAFRFRKG